VLYDTPVGETAENLALKKLIDRRFLATPWYGSRQMARWLRRQGLPVDRHRVRGLMRKMRLVPIYQPPRTSQPHPQHKVFPYQLKGLEITRPNQVWCSGITYIPMRRGFLYQVAIMDRASRAASAWRLSNTMDVSFGVVALEEALARCGHPDIYNTDSQMMKASSRAVSDEDLREIAMTYNLTPRKWTLLKTSPSRGFTDSICSSGDGGIDGGSAWIV
jgi:putative transposase